jgi:hypothetical protein
MNESNNNQTEVPLTENQIGSKSIGSQPDLTMNRQSQSGPETISDFTLHLISRMKSGVAENVQKEIALFINLLPDLEKAGDAALLRSADMALRVLLSDNPNVEFSQEIRKDIQYRTKWVNSRFKTVFYSSSPVSSVVFGLVSLVVLLLFAIVLVTTVWGTSSYFSGNQVSLSVSTAIVAACVGALGSFVSIMVRLTDFAKVEAHTDRTVLFLTGFAKPLIGAAFAFFVYAIFNSGIFEIKVGDGKELYLFSALSFLAGFSERFARDILSRTEEALARNNTNGTDQNTKTGST